MRYPGARLLLMARAPMAGRAKTRLIPALGEEGAARLHAYLVERTVAQALSSTLAPLELWGAGECEHPFFLSLRQRYHFTLHCQWGQDLGDRMAHALSSALERGEYAVLFGSDIPELTQRVLYEACEALEAGHDAVIVPAEDGGYALLGLRQVSAELFDGIAWGSDRVMAQTRERLQGLGWLWRELAPLWDLDRPQDLARLAQLPDLPEPLRKLLQPAV